VGDRDTSWGQPHDLDPWTDNTDIRSFGSDAEANREFSGSGHQCLTEDSECLHSPLTDATKTADDQRPTLEAYQQLQNLHKRTLEQMASHEIECQRVVAGLEAQLQLSRQPVVAAETRAPDPGPTVRLQERTLDTIATREIEYQRIITGLQTQLEVTKKLLAGQTQLAEASEAARNDIAANAQVELERLSLLEAAVKELEVDAKLLVSPRPQQTSEKPFALNFRVGSQPLLAHTEPLFTSSAPSLFMAPTLAALPAPLMPSRAESPRLQGAPQKRTASPPKIMSLLPSGPTSVR